MKEVATVGIDIAKSVFQVHGINAVGDVVNRAISLLTAEGVMPAIRAAGEKPPCSTTRTNTSISPDRLVSIRAMMISSHK